MKLGRLKSKKIEKLSEEFFLLGGYRNESVIEVTSIRTRRFKVCTRTE
ncbi:hypothetical protein bthur0011_47850 [Bacillus thuringiensis serovar huazhongensis BGSC 4BD1]|nr:hypothetical protein bthur0011_47850 [Bacillus thuringiensis serovar huazhongensis BGSC 4BD1]